MPITPFLHSEAFDPEIITVMSAAFAKSCTSLGLADKADPMTELVARHIIVAVQQGIRTDTGLYLSVLQEFGPKPL
jgi:hypothetical protein